MRSKLIYTVFVIALLLGWHLPTLNVIAQDTNVGYISFSSNRSGNYDIYMIDRHGGNLQRLTDHPANELHAKWSPDGRFMAYASKETGNYEIYVMDMKSKQRHQLTDHPANDTTPAWSPDGKWIAFVSNRTGKYNTYRMDINGEKLRRLTKKGDDFSPTWSPDGKWIAFNSLQNKLVGLYIMSPDGRKSRWLASAAGQGRQAAWSPDSKHLAFATWEFGIGVKVAITDLEGEDFRIVTLGGRGAGGFPIQKQDPAWSPDGKWIAYVSENLEFPFQLKSSLYIVDAAGEERADSLKLTTHLSKNISPAWVPEGFLSVSPSVEKLTTLWGKLKKP